MFTYEQITEIVRRHGEDDLAAWVDARLPAGIAARRCRRHAL
jgi:hypothetical protein